MNLDDTIERERFGEIYRENRIDGKFFLLRGDEEPVADGNRECLFESGRFGDIDLGFFNALPAVLWIDCVAIDVDAGWDGFNRAGDANAAGFGRRQCDGACTCRCAKPLNAGK